MAGYSDDLIASGTILASIALLLLGCAPASSAGMVNAYGVRRRLQRRGLSLV
ncbi:MAG: hypothetical protein NTZ86_06205 [Legionellales bacterium]|nr:hypothetical protein [Legionellales bacterium]